MFEEAAGLLYLVCVALICLAVAILGNGPALAVATLAIVGIYALGVLAAAGVAIARAQI
jgi:hypothetical protein